MIHHRWQKVALPEHVQEQTGWDFWDRENRGDHIAIGIWKGRRRVEVVIHQAQMDDMDFDVFGYLREKVAAAFRAADTRHTRDDAQLPQPV